MIGSSRTDGIAELGDADRVAVLVHVVEEAADELRCDFGLQRPGRVRVADAEREIGHVGGHHPLVGHLPGEVDLGAIDSDLRATEELEIEAGRGNDQVGIELGT